MKYLLTFATTSLTVLILNVSPSSHCSAFTMRNGWGPIIPSNTNSKLRSTASSDETSPSHTNGDESGTSLKTTDVLSLDSIRASLIRQEETIIFALIERSQFRHNKVIYESGGLGDLGIPPGTPGACLHCVDEEGEEKGQLLSFLEWLLIGTEALHCAVRRYTSPEEHPFFPCVLPEGPLPTLPTLDYPSDLLSPKNSASSVNYNNILLKRYISEIVPAITKEGDDEQHGSSCISDISCLQALSKRVHYGKFVAESKYRSDPEAYQKLVDDGDAIGVMELLTNAKVEEQVLRRARLKAATYGRDPILTTLPDPVGGKKSDSTSFVAAVAASAVATAMEVLDDKYDEDDPNSKIQKKIDPRVIESVYRDIIIPLTKDIEVAYLFKRCGREPPGEYHPDRISSNLLRFSTK